jgi:hypothetical protein
MSDQDTIRNAIDENQPPLPAHLKAKCSTYHKVCIHAQQ